MSNTIKIEGDVGYENVVDNLTAAKVIALIETVNRSQSATPEERLGDE